MIDPAIDRFKVTAQLSYLRSSDSIGGGGDYGGRRDETERATRLSLFFPPPLSDPDSQSDLSSHRLHRSRTDCLSMSDHMRRTHAACHAPCHAAGVDGQRLGEISRRKLLLSNCALGGREGGGRERARLLGESLWEGAKTRTA